MSIHSKRAAVVIGVLAVFAIARDIVRTGSGDLGAVSFGAAEVLVEFVVPAMFIGVLVYWFSRRSSRRPTARR
jgi:hypothetical protein